MRRQRVHDRDVEIGQPFATGVVTSPRIRVDGRQPKPQDARLISRDPRDDALDLRHLILDVAKLPHEPARDTGHLNEIKALRIGGDEYEPVAHVTPELDGRCNLAVPRLGERVGH
jgi:hypothetical protein